MASSWLGFKDALFEELSKGDEPTYLDSFVGGIPLLPTSINLAPNDLKCGTSSCSSQMVCLAQLCCPLDTHANMHRALLLLVCPTPKCDKTIKGWKVFRIQWKAESKEEKTIETMDKRSKQVFDQTDCWDEEIDANASCWGTTLSSISSTVTKADDKNEANSKLTTPRVQFEQKFKPFLVEFDAESWNVGVDDNDDESEDGDGEDEENMDTASSGPNSQMESTDDKDFSDMQDFEAMNNDVFRKFYNIVSKEPEQIMRYGGMGQYIAVYSDQSKLPSKCEKCGCTLGCELQLLPTIQNALIPFESNTTLTLPVCSLGIFTCPNTSTCSDFDVECLKITNLFLEIES